MNPTRCAPPPVALVMDRYDDVAHTHTALAAHDPAAGRITLHPGPGTTSDTALAHDLLAALGKPPLLPGRFRAGRQPAWEAATAWIAALPAARLTVLRAHRLTARRIECLLHLRDITGIPLTLVCHRTHLTTALHRALHPVPHTVTSDLDTARSHYYGGAPAATGPQPSAQTPTASPVRWMTVPALDRLVSYDSTQPCTGPCTPAPIDWRHRPPPRPLTEAAVREITRRIHRATAHPRLAAALAATLLTRASFQQLLTVRAEDLGPDAATLAFHDPARYTDGCAVYPVPAWTRPFLRAAASFAALTGSRELLARQDERPHILHLAENARLRPPQPPQPAGTGAVVWDWAERGQAERYETLLSRPTKPSRPRR
ncbi:hypothetical protein PV396_43420 [Streptomyces sp. ME02-8801-2C]|uniref:hypothetical protein n=1 Tax=Streptomyces sp. ME02-8801-2C TaxID=3028680 RepID=UPI0029A9B09A|nr:hypothetical protein [Streptomyces sp. ME02-8801-2C]MDX3458701.1 hypothetical protein [Streptomyces sp. ME02-8801-2C]